ncbi:hypothetical protein AHAS_Ahas09G0281300 [Arachis hypogaea]
MGSKSSPSMVALAIVLQHVTCRVVQVQAGRDAAKSFAADSRVLRGGGKGGPAMSLRIKELPLGANSGNRSKPRFSASCKV